MGKHAILSASGSSRWVRCPGSPAFTAGLKDLGSKAAQEGTAAHFLAAYCLKTMQYPCIGDASIPDPRIFEGRRIVSGVTPEGEDVTDFQDNFDFKVNPDSVTIHVVTREMANSVSKYVKYIRDLLDEHPSLVVLIEQVLDISFLTGEPDAIGTADAVLINPDGLGFVLAIHDFKYGYTPVDAEDNEQLMLYAASAIDQYGVAYDIGDDAVIRLGIHQPRYADGEPKIWDFRLKDRIYDFTARIVHAATTAWGLVQGEKSPLEVMSQLIPGNTQCQWCIGKGKCPALTELVCEATGVVIYDDLAVKLGACDLVESWVKAVRAEAYDELNRGHRVPGYKLVPGRKGPRKWSDPIEAEQFLKAIRLKVDEMYEKTLTTPTALEKIIGPKGTTPQPSKWNRVQQLITQAVGKPSIAMDTDLRETIKPLQFNDIGDS